jgi:hypothetical protein
MAEPHKRFWKPNKESDMSTMVISNPAIDQEAATLITKTYEVITPHWRDTMPAVTIVIADTPFNRVPALREFCDAQERQPGWEKKAWNYTQVICPEFGEGRATLWVRYDRDSLMDPREYYFQKALFAAIGKTIWFSSKKVRDEVQRNATGFAAQSGVGAYMAFRDTFSRFFLNPEYLQERREEAWRFMSLIDRALATA